MTIRLSRLKWMRKSFPQVYVRGDSIYICVNSHDSDSKGRIRHHYSIRSRNGKKAINLLEQLAEMDKKISDMDFYWAENYIGVSPKAHEYAIKTPSPLGLNNDFFNKAVQGSNSMTYRNTYTSMGINFRSKNELIVAELLKDLGLKFKYEPRIVLGNNVEIYPDFLIGIEEADRCFVFEMQGMMNDANYALKASQKETIYINHGFRDGKDILFFKAGNDSIDFDVLRLFIEAVVEANIKEAFGLS